MVNDITHASIDAVGQIVVAIDGPAGAGKSTVGRRLAARLGVGYLDTGAMYRAVTWAALDRGIAPDSDGVADLVDDLHISVEASGVWVDDVDVTAAIRIPTVNEHVSAVAANSTVRAELVRQQRRWVDQHGGGVVEGRDIGSVVFPDATAKLYITASPRVRAERRVGELGGDVAEIERTIVERDRRDSTRSDSPLTTTPDMIVVDTSELDIDEVVDRLVELVASQPSGVARAAASTDTGTTSATNNGIVDETHGDRNDGAGAC